MATIFLTGGTGFIGSHLAEALVKDGHTVRALVRSDPKWLDGVAVETVRGDLSNPGLLRETLRGVDVVYHVAGLTRAPLGPAGDAALHDANVTATTDLLDAVLDAAPDARVVVTSSLAAVGKRPSSGVADEATPLRPISRYGASKAAMEAAIRPYFDRLRMTVVRPPAVYGPREADIFTVFQTAAKYRLFAVVGDPKPLALTLVHVRDLVSGYRLAAQERAVGGTYFFGSERDYSWAEIRDATAKALGHRLATLRIPKALVVPIGTLVERIGRMAGQYPPLNREKALEIRDACTRCDSGRAIVELGYDPSVDLEKGLAETIRWYRENGWL
ncbi:MAG: NAD-dependent epimerase/dehydratase family protein [Bacteroidetes bacterium]|nr:NAD-dependent epimerase/dehydratase family protein [Bacteroidota bacterium]